MNTSQSPTITMQTPTVTLPSFPPTAVPCPDWCTTGPGHGYECEDAEGFDMRFHTLGVGRVPLVNEVLYPSHGLAIVEIMAQAVWRSDAEDLIGPVVQLALDCGGNSGHADLDAEQARTLATLLVQAARELERITV